MSKHKDMKESLTTARKADITHVRTAFLTYTARPCEYGSDKYERANFRRPTGDAVHIVPTRADFERFRSYLRAAVSHAFDTLDSMEAHLANDPQLLDVEGMKIAAYAVDTDVTPGSKVGPSMLPHVAAACASLNMAITQATDCGLLPRDPGTPWRNALPKATAQSDLEALLQTLPQPEPLDESKIDWAALKKASQDAYNKALERFTEVK